MHTHLSDCLFIKRFFLWANLGLLIGLAFAYKQLLVFMHMGQLVDQSQLVHDLITCYVNLVKSTIVA